MKATLLFIALCLAAASGVLGDKPISIGSLGGNFGNFCGRLCCLGGITIPQQCQKTCALIDCAPPTPLPVPGQCPNVRICCESGPKPPPCQELCKRVRIDCRCNKDDCCGPLGASPRCKDFCSTVRCATPKCSANICCPPDEFPEECDIGICAAVTCAVDPPPTQCTSNDCCPPGPLTPGCEGFCAAVSCVVPPISPTPSNCSVFRCCRDDTPRECWSFCKKNVDCSKSCCPPVSMGDIDCRDCGLRG